MPSRVLLRPILIALLAVPFLLAGAVNPGAARPGFAPAPAPLPGLSPDIEESVAVALDALSSAVRRRSREDALRISFEAYYRYRAANPEQVRKPYLYYVDLGLDNRTGRGYVFDMVSLAVVAGPFMVAHGSGSSRQRDGVPTVFSNRSGSYASSLGLYVAEETYTFRGKSGGRAYTSVGLRMRGESGRFNGAARSRGIVAHGAPYVTSGAAGRSEGCPAMEQARAQRLLPLLADGGVVFIFSPNDDEWLRSDPWAGI
ncbi:MAG: murein L,D-transpeptidase catalytic domain-containing protein [Gemmatimonadota bacterium]